jgi:hypothetical protein
MREAEVLDLMELQFLLSYHGKITKEDSDKMTIFELRQWYILLKKQVVLENDAVNK